MPHSNETSTNLSRPGSGLSLSVLGWYKFCDSILIDSYNFLFAVERLVLAFDSKRSKLSNPFSTPRGSLH